MGILFRRTRIEDIEALFDVRSRTRENPISRERLAEMGITHASTAEGFESGVLCGWVAVVEGGVVGFCTGDTESGEVLVLALLPAFEGQGVGKTLLSNVVEELLLKGIEPLWLAADSNSDVRAHGFYRYLGWKPTGQVLENGDEILQFRGLA